MKRRTLLQSGAGVFIAAQAEISGAKTTTDPGAPKRREELYGLLGKLPPRNRKVGVQLVSTEDRGSYTLEKLILDLNGEEAAPAYFAKPKGATGKLPTVLFNHSHGGGYQIGKTEFIEGREYMSKPPYAEFLTSLGFNALCFDTWIFGERAKRTELDFFKDTLWHGRVLWGMMVYDALKAVDYLVTRPDVDAQRLATVGMSMGSSTAQWAGALAEDPLNHFTTTQMNALIAPRAHLSLAGNQDALTPVAGLEKIDRGLQEVYASAGHPEHWKLLRYDGEHLETPVMREEIRKWLVAHL